MIEIGQSFCYLEIYFLTYRSQRVRAVIQSFIQSVLTFSFIAWYGSIIERHRLLRRIYSRNRLSVKPARF